MIELDDVFVLYPCLDREVAALRGLSLNVAARERVVVTGPSGSGKSTLVKLVTGQVRPSAGAAVVLDHDLANASTRAVAALQRTRVGMITQQTVNNLAPELSVIDNAAMQCRLTGSSKADAADAALEMLDRLGVADLADRGLRTISAGEAQRVALAAALSHRPHIIVADEPTGTLDADNATIVFDLLAQVCDELGAAMLVVSHDPEAGRIGHRVLDIRDGRLGAEQLLGNEAIRLVVDSRGWVRLPEPERVRAGISSRAIVSSTNGHGEASVVLRPPAGGIPTTALVEPVGAVDVEHTPLVVLDAVGRSIGATRILPATTLTVNAGELLIVAGRSGSGKTTLLGLIAGLAEPSEGNVTRIADVAVAVAANAPGFAESMTVRQNIELACTVRGREVDNALTAMIDEYLTDVSLIDLAERPVSTLSGGERQRAAIVRALAGGAELVLLDEPTSQLDQGLARRIATFLVGQARRGRAIVCASHEPELIAAADRGTGWAVAPTHEETNADDGPGHMTQLRHYDSDDVRRLAPMADAIDALRACFAAQPTHIARSPYDAAGGEFMLMPAVDGGAAGVKLLMIQPANTARGEPVIQGIYVLFDADAGRPVALLDGAALTNVRTPAISAVATDGLARSDVRTLGIVGAGPQALGHLEAMLSVRPDISSVTVASRTRANAEAAVERAIADQALVVGRDVRGGSFDEASHCDLVCVATRSSVPVVTAAMIDAGTHINAVGSYRTDMRELAADLVAASTVVVDDVGAAHDEAGDLALAIDDGVWAWDRLAGDLAAVASGRLTRRDDGEITLFKSVGLAVEDLVIARLVAALDGLL